jgi:Lrp/AsnC family transcriptional regulator for asnA, asnC and gidA
VLEDRGAWLLIRQLLDGSLEEVRPVLDSSTVYGFRYPVAESILEGDSKDTVDRLEKLRRAGILEGELVEVIFVCAECASPDVHPQYQCMNCSGFRLRRISVIEHFSCGYLAPRSEFQGEKEGLRCPQCGQRLEGEQQDYKSEFAFQCLECNSVSTKPRLVFRCFKCQSVSLTSEMQEQPVYIYRLNLEHRADIIHYLGFHPTPEGEKPSRKKRREDFDDVDRRILNILQRDGRLSFRNVAKRLKVSDATIRSRVSRLEQKNVIKGFTTLVDPLQAGMEAITLIQLEVDTKVLTKTVQSLQAIEEVKLVMETGERRNLILLGAFTSREALNTFLDSNIRGIPGVQLHTVTVALGLQKYDWMIQF